MGRLQAELAAGRRARERQGASFAEEGASVAGGEGEGPWYQKQLQQVMWRCTSATSSWAAAAREARGCGRCQHTYTPMREEKKAWTPSRLERIESRNISPYLGMWPLTSTQSKARVPSILFPPSLFPISPESPDQEVLKAAVTRPLLPSLGASQLYHCPTRQSSTPPPRRK